MKIISVLVALAIPYAIEALVLRSPLDDAVPQVPTTGCDVGGDKAHPVEGAYETAYLKAFYDSASAQLFQGKGKEADKARKEFDLNGDGALDCKEFDRMVNRLGMKGAGELTHPHITEAISAHIMKDHQWPPIAQPPAPAYPPPLPAGHKCKGLRKLVKACRGHKHHKKKSCMPMCSWSCPKHPPKCAQICKPRCSPPQCQTRCSGMSTAGCQLECGKPRCAVICPKVTCAEKDCAICKTECSKPQCNLNCPSGGQNCSDVCENPRCEWECQEPSPEMCKMPQCTMSCDTPRSCGGESFKALPPITANETLVKAFETPLLLNQQSAGMTRNKEGVLSMMVPITTAVAVPGSKELKLVTRTVRIPVMEKVAA